HHRSPWSPQLSTLTPTDTLSYTTLFRSSRRHAAAPAGCERDQRTRLAAQLEDDLSVDDLTGSHEAQLVVNRSDRRRRDHLRAARSEEHTSELQSLANLVCRLLLEKKKTT